MGTKKEDPRDISPAPYKEESEKRAKEWYKEFDFKLAEIDMGKVLEYWFVYRFIGIYEHGK